MERLGLSDDVCDQVEIMPKSTSSTELGKRQLWTQIHSSMLEDPSNMLSWLFPFPAQISDLSPRESLHHSSSKWELNKSRGVVNLHTTVMDKDLQICGLHSHKIVSLQQGKPCCLGILCNPCSDQERCQAGCSDTEFNLVLMLRILCTH